MPASGHLTSSVDEAASDPHILQKIIDTGRQLIEEDGAETLILGCSGLAAHRKAAQLELGVPVIDPVQAAVTDGGRIAERRDLKIWNNRICIAQKKSTHKRVLFLSYLNVRTIRLKSLLPFACSALCLSI